jgi:hypothetical protein
MMTMMTHMKDRLILSPASRHDLKWESFSPEIILTWWESFSPEIILTFFSLSALIFTLCIAVCVHKYDGVPGSSHCLVLRPWRKAFQNFRHVLCSFLSLNGIFGHTVIQLTYNSALKTLGWTCSLSDVQYSIVQVVQV